ncbi:MAG: hypothetical protein LBG73_01330 [Spirochaetaceae bacterium]|jgi:hypothetical protein|nr:hypothetical protein [Spirochaetaceae bacterium]
MSKRIGCNIKNDRLLKEKTPQIGSEDIAAAYLREKNAEVKACIGFPFPKRNSQEGQ